MKIYKFPMLLTYARTIDGEEDYIVKGKLRLWSSYGHWVWFRDPVLDNKSFSVKAWRKNSNHYYRNFEVVGEKIEQAKKELGL